ncbi:MAG: ATP-dependent DNA helicase RecG [Ruminococcaceae bacterium]|nr:ATP-dependent DNA helicase RecG [Oscillospiraceae bacterium]
MATNGMLASIRQLPGVGEKRAAVFSRLHIATLGDLLSHYPRTYENRKTCKRIIDLQHEETTCIKAVVFSAVKTSVIRKNMRVHTARVSDGTGFLDLVWFNNRFIEQKLKKGETYIFYGKVRLSPKRQMQTPLFEVPGAQKQTGRIFPIYPLTEGLSDGFFASCTEQALSLLQGQITDTLPQKVREAYGLCDLETALQNIHFPTDRTGYESARRRLAFEELFLFQSALLTLKKNGKRASTASMSASPLPFIQSLPYALTNAQERVIREITADLYSSTVMNRLVCGDVGSGKTAVAAAAIYTAVKSGFQAAFMAPTEILATQHYKSLSVFYANHGIKIELLLGSMSASARAAAVERLASGESHVAVGTHALFSEKVTFHSLGLAITDEQHRFGVNQRHLLSQKGENPHVLVMSATPIPRTLALIVYGDLDVSLIDELPPGRQKIDTFAVTEQYRKRIYTFIQKELDAGRQAYIVCPLIEENEALELQAATDYAKKLQESVFPGYSIGLLHGKMKNAEKDAVMAQFKNGELQLLVATTVIEVGVDVPNATIMLIENAERFGLSQLHQLRGRIGRGEHKSYCILINQSKHEAAKERLLVMQEQSDGFKIAEEDLKQRGPGEFFGTRQHGLPDFKIVNIYSDMPLLQETTRAAQDFVEERLTCTREEKQALYEKMNALFNNRVTFNKNFY